MSGENDVIRVVQKCDLHFVYLNRYKWIKTKEKETNKWLHIQRFISHKQMAMELSRCRGGTADWKLKTCLSLLRYLENISWHGWGKVREFYFLNSTETLSIFSPYLIDTQKDIRTHDVYAWSVGLGNDWRSGLLFVGMAGASWRQPEESATARPFDQRRSHHGVISRDFYAVCT